MYDVTATDGAGENINPGDTFYYMFIGLDQDREVISYAILELVMPDEI